MVTLPSALELSTSDSLHRFLEDFERGQIPIAEWTHAAHVAAAGSLLLECSPDEALSRMRAGIQKLLAFNGIETTLTRGYHESVTRLWIHTCNAFLVESGIEGAEAVRTLVACFGERAGLHKEYWDYDVLTSEPARHGWQPPNLRPVPAAWRSNDRWISCNPKYLNTPMIHAFLAGTYWAPGIPRELVERCIRGSLPFGVYHRQEQVGFARVITDYASYGYLADVFILETYRGQGLAIWLMECIRNHPSLQGFRRWQLATRDAHGLYRRFGFQALSQPDRLMEFIPGGDG